MNNLAIFDHKEFGSVRIVEQDSGLWFVAKDVCEALVLGMCGAAWGAVFAGNDYIKHNKENSYAATMYVVGMWESVAVFSIIDVPENANVGQIKTIYDKYLTDNPSQTHKPAYLLFLDSLKNAFGLKE